MKIAVCLASRGLVFGEVEHSLEYQRQFYQLQVFRSWDKTLPDAQNYLVEKALAESTAEFILFVEEDTVMPEEGLDLLYIGIEKYHADITCIDYGVNGFSCTAREKKTNELLWCGLGCTLIKREVFDALEKPYFRSDMALRLNDWKWIESHEPYGGQDIWFCMKAREKGFTIAQIPGVEAKHLRLDSLGKPETNKGLHQISQKPQIIKKQVITIPMEHDYYLTTTKKSTIMKIIGNDLPTSYV